MNKQPTWAEVVEARHKREDEPVARRFAQWAHLGCGHLRNDLVWGKNRIEEEEQ